MIKHVVQFQWACVFQREASGSPSRAQ
jgi:hypothetical protein